MVFSLFLKFLRFHLPLSFDCYKYQFSYFPFSFFFLPVSLSLTLSLSLSLKLFLVLTRSLFLTPSQTSQVPLLPHFPASEYFQGPHFSFSLFFTKFLKSQLPSASSDHKIFPGSSFISFLRLINFPSSSLSLSQIFQLLFPSSFDRLYSFPISFTQHAVSHFLEPQSIDLLWPHSVSSYFCKTSTYLLYGNSEWGKKGFGVLQYRG